jgi:hypothetical protein
MIRERNERTGWQAPQFRPYLAGHKCQVEPCEIEVMPNRLMLIDAYAHLSPAFLSAKVGLLDPPKPTSRAKPQSTVKPASAATPTAALTQASLATEEGKNQKGQERAKQKFGEEVAIRTADCGEIGSSGWTRTSNPPVNRRKPPILPPVAAPCIEMPDRGLDPIITEPIDDRGDAAVSRRIPRFGVSKGQEKGEVED